MKFTREELKKLAEELELHNDELRKEMQRAADRFKAYLTRIIQSQRVEADGCWFVTALHNDCVTTTPA